MARNTDNKTSAPVMTREDFVAQFCAPQASAAPGGAGVVAQFFGNRIANIGDSFAAVSAGVEAAGRNYNIARQTEMQRQASRTYDRLVSAGLVKQ